MHPYRIAVDIDEVLCPFVHTMAKWSKRKIPKGKYPYDYAIMFKISRNEAQRMVYSFYDSDEFKEMKPLELSRLYLDNIKKDTKKIYAVTGRQRVCELDTIHWINKWYPGIFDDVILTDSYTQREIAKADVCKSLAISVMIDDNYKTCVECMDVGINAINYVGEPMYPWAMTSVISCKNWAEVDAKLKRGSNIYF